MHIRSVTTDSGWLQGGATFRHYPLYGQQYSSDHQVVFVPKTKTLWIKIMDRDWQKVELAPLFGA